ncbi:fumarylacetoacetate hydrolase family protein [Intestinirhabdus alba]|jgi:2-keto-4-pentenoate hydratase/2-oxohepta-3-ene-1,7-dioic acid hydratase in catechol pathway|uniref:FAA hydrolase family protein n=1 Tax=Intestinirhabdus alba TaxID=2899544 RepID=A0A6L6IK88_9ENTR|nr:fumarylacetoacetate hydrolase family protein [Intestinirhabdus alba]MTH46128.1 FAA hydrolase family protein [Intestinirhabdus alba]
MKLLSFTVNDQNKYGLVTTGGIIDLQALFPQYGSLLDFIPCIHLLDKLPPSAKKANYTFEEIVFLPVITNPKKIICAGINYGDKKITCYEKPSAPVLFIRFADSQTGHLTPLLKPERSNEFDYEGEMALVIGRGGRNIPQQEALSHIAGYSCYMDSSVRDWQHSWFTAGKNWPATGGFGPWLVTADEISDPQKLNITTRLNGQTVQQDNTSSMVYSVAELIAYISTFTALSPGDVILTGTPGGIGKKRTPPLFMRPGDIVEVEIERIGCLVNPVCSDAIGK